MSSMFKKKGGLAFKPKIPSTRTRSAAPPPSSQPTNIIPQGTSDPSSDSATRLRSSVPIDAEDTAKRNRTADHSASDDEQHQALQETTPAKPNETDLHKRSLRQRASDKTTDNALDIQTPVSSDAQGVDDGGPRPQSSSDAQHVDSVVDTPQGDVTNEEPNRLSRFQAANNSSTASPPPVRESVEETGSAPEVDQASVDADGTANGSTSNEPKSATTLREKEQGGRRGIQDVPNDGGEKTKLAKRGKAGGQNGDPLQQAKPRKRKAESKNETAGPNKIHRARSLTPEDAETQVVDLQKLRMSDLTKDLHIGKKFSRHDELRDRERQARLKARLSRANSQAEENDERQKSQETDSRDSVPAKASSDSPALPPTPAAGPQFRIVDGQIVVDQSSLVMDRHARAAAARAGQDMETVEENDFTRLITSSSFLNSSKLKGPNIWSDEETELFYRGLQMFGTEFEMISKMFPNKRRRHVKLKFNREERHCPERIDAVLVGKKTTKMDIEVYKALTRSEFEPVEAIELEQRKIQEGYETEQKRIADEQAEIMRKKREELFADDGNEDGIGKKLKSNKKKGKQAVAYGLNGQPITS